MLFPDLDRARRLARERLTVLDSETKQHVPFIFNEEQDEILTLAASTKRLIIGKGRQIGNSTVIVFLLMLIALMNPGMPIAIVADDQGKANGLLAKIKGWLKQLGVPLVVKNVESIELVNGATIDALSAVSTAEDGESRVGRSKSYGVLYASEMAFWRNARAVWAALTGTMPTYVIVDSTGAPGKTLYRELWESVSGWVKKFFKIEDHKKYELPEKRISDERWAELRDRYKFTSRRAAAWWEWKLTTDIKNEQKMIREFPVLEEHMWMLRDGQHIGKWTEAKPRQDGDWDIYVEKIDEPIIFGVDTAAGLGGDADASSIFMLGQRTGKTLRTFRSNEMKLRAFEGFVLEQVEKWQPIAVVVERNGIGEAVWGAVEHVDGAEQQKSAFGELFDRRDAFRLAIEQGPVQVGGHFLAECRSSVIKVKTNNDGQVRPVFVGHDDVISAGSFAWKWREQNPYVAPPVEAGDPREVFVPKKKRRGRAEITV